MPIATGSSSANRSFEEASSRGQIPTDEDIGRQLDRILEHPLFQKSHRLAAFLRFTVQTSLAGKADQLKEQVIGSEVFGRGDGYNPQEDPVVRIMAGRVRSKLAEYYLSDGQSDSVLIELPRGGYVPRATRRQAGSPANPVIEEQPRGKKAVRHIVGRDRQLEILSEALASARAGTGSVIAVSGDAGLGKTALIEDFLSAIEVDSGTVCIGRGRCSERLAETDAFVPILQWLDELRRGDCGENVVQTMRESAPTWYRELSSASDGTSSSKENNPVSNERMRRELLHLVQRLSASRPLLLFLDDMHWADASTCDLLAYLGPHIGAMRVLVLTAHRPATALANHNPFLALKHDLERREVCHEMPLSFLAQNDVAAYIASQFPANRFPGDFARVVHERTEGNPFFMSDLLRFLKDSGHLERDDRQWRLGQPLAEIGRMIPVGAQSMIRLKIQQIGEEDRRILLCAALQGWEFDSEVIVRVLELDPVDVEERLQELDTMHRFVQLVGEQEFPNGAFSLRYRFVHVFYQNALQASLAPSRRATHSLAIANTLIALTGRASTVIAADLAILFETSRDHANAVRFFLLAARNAGRVSAFPEAANLCERGLRCLQQLPESRERNSQELMLSLNHGIALMSTRGYASPEAERTHRRSRELCIELGDRRRLSRVLWGLHTCEANAGNLTAAHEIALEMRSAADSSSDRQLIVESLHALGTTLAFMGRLPEARAALQRIFELLPADQHEFPGEIYVLDPCVTSLSMLARLLEMMGLLRESMEWANHAVDRATRLAHPQSISYAKFWVGWIHHIRGNHEEARSHLDATMAMSLARGIPQIMEWARVVRGSELAHLGQVEEGIAAIRASMQNQSTMRSTLEHAYCLTLLAEAMGKAERYQEAVCLCGEALEFSARTGGRSYDPETRRIRGEMLLKAGGEAYREQALSEFESAIAIARETQCRALELRAAVSYARLCSGLGEPSRGRPVLAAAVDFFDPAMDTGYLNEARLLLAALA